MRLITCNVRSVADKARAHALLDLLLRLDPHTLILTEFPKLNDAGRRIIAQMESLGYQISNTDVKRGVLIASKQPFKPLFNPLQLPVDDGTMLEADFSSWRLFGVYLPQDELKFPHFDALIRIAETSEKTVPCIAIGDFNAGRNTLDIEPFRRCQKVHTPFSAAKHYERLEQHWIEAWRYKHPDGDEYTWYSKRRGGWNGFRLDHCFLSPSLRARLIDAYYVHEVRTEKLTDHSALVVEIAV